jgi:hypothetical protein
MGACHEGGSLLVARQHKLNRGLSDRFHHVEVFLSGYSENLFYALVLERTDQKI